MSTTNTLSAFYTFSHPQTQDLGFRFIKSEPDLELVASTCQSALHTDARIRAIEKSIKDAFAKLDVFCEPDEASRLILLQQIVDQELKATAESALALKRGEMSVPTDQFWMDDY